jgi:hypothetical protein
VDVPELVRDEETEPQRDEHVGTAAVAAEYSERMAELDGRERMLAAAGAELAFRERRLLEREAAVEAATARLASQAADRLLAAEGEDDELARVRARRHSSVL